MRATTHTTQVLTPFGSGYVPEQHGDDILCNLPPSEGVICVDRAIKALRGAMFDEVLKSLRGALALR